MPEWTVALGYQVASLSLCRLSDLLRLALLALNVRGPYGFRLLIPYVRWQRRRE